MPLTHPTELPAPDLFSLALSPMSTRVDALELAWREPEERGHLPARSVQIAGLIVAETVRLIRLGSRSELTEAALELVQLVAGTDGDAPAGEHSESYRLANGAAVVLGVASAPSSAGGEFAVLRSWNGKAREAVELLNRAHGNALPRSELRSALGDLTESHLSHLLADLESSGLAIRIRDGKTVTVHLGPVGRSKPVQEQLMPSQLPSLKYRGPARDLDAAPVVRSIYARPTGLGSVTNFHVFGEGALAHAGLSAVKRELRLRYLHDHERQEKMVESNPMAERIAGGFQAFLGKFEERQDHEDTVSPVEMPAGISSLAK